MKFYSDEPNLHIIRQRMIGNRVEHFELCVFDENCEVDTEDKEVIRQLINIYRHDETETVKATKVVKVESPKEESVKCNKCSETFENKGLLMAHYRKSHPKNGK